MRLLPRLTFLRKPLNKSLTLHGVLLLLAIFGLPRVSRPPETPAAVQVTLVGAEDLPQAQSPAASAPPPPEAPRPRPETPPAA
ncbi:hypothetical protein, partial [Mangrovicoccus algicola]